MHGVPQTVHRTQYFRTGDRLLGSSNVDALYDPGEMLDNATYLFRAVRLIFHPLFDIVKQFDHAFGLCRYFAAFERLFFDDPNDLIQALFDR